MEQISVVVPVYNCEKYIKECVDSILAQTYSEIEIILVDDGSLDKSGQICDEYAKKYSNIISIHQENRGISSARLKGAGASKGQWITFVDADDWIDQDFYQTLWGDESDCDLIISGIYRYYNNEKCKREYTYYESGIYDKKHIIEQVIPNMLWNPITGIWSLDPSLCTKLFRRNKLLYHLEKAEKVKSDYGEDSLVVFPMMLHIEKMKVVKEPFYYHRQREAGIISPYVRDNSFFDKLHCVYQYLEGEFQRMGYLEIMHEQLEHFYINSVDLKKKAYGGLGYGLFPIFPFYQIKREDKVILYGAGKVGKAYMEQNLKYNFCNIIFWADKNFETIECKETILGSPKLINEYAYDYIVIAIDRYETALKAKDDLCKMGVPEKKIIWHSTRKSMNKLYTEKKDV